MQLGICCSAEVAMLATAAVMQLDSTTRKT